MMLRAKSNPWMRTKALYIIPVATIAVSVFATPELNNRVDTLAEKVETIIEDQVSEKEIDSADNIKEKIAKNAKENLTATAEKNTKSALDTCTWNENDPATWQEKSQADVWPLFPGGNDARTQYEHQPKYAHLSKAGGPTLFVDLVIEKDGSVIVKGCHFLSNLKIDEKKKQKLIEEAKEMYASMPKWIPAQKNGENVRYEYTTGFEANIEYEKIEPPVISWND